MSKAAPNALTIGSVRDTRLTGLVPAGLADIFRAHLLVLVLVLVLILVLGPPEVAPGAAVLARPLGLPFLHFRVNLVKLLLYLAATLVAVPVCFLARGAEDEGMTYEWRVRC